MLAKGPHCAGCVLETQGVGFMHADGTGANGVLLVLEALGKDEAVIGRPLVGATGLQVEEMFHRGGYHRDDFKIANTVWCQPPGQNFPRQSFYAAAVAHCRPYLDEVIASMRPRCIVAAGSVAWHRLIPECSVGIDEARGYVFWSQAYQTWVVPTIHPARILRGQTALVLVFLHDVTRAVTIAREGFQYVPLASFLTLDPTPIEAGRWVDAYERSPSIAHLAVDIETHDKDWDEDDLVADGRRRGGEAGLLLVPTDEEEDRTIQAPILRCGYSYHTADGPHVLSLPWGGEYTPYHQRLLASPIPKVFWNKGFDVPRLLTTGLRLRGALHDGMDSWHVLNSDLRRGLGFVTTFLNAGMPMWKHQSRERPAYYNACDAYNQDHNQLEIVALLKQHQLWEVYQRQILEFDPVASAMTAAGLPVDVTSRQHAAQRITALYQENRVAMQALIPDQLRRYRPVHGYQRPPADTTGLVEQLFDVPIQSQSLFGGTTEKQRRWAKRLPFVPSPKQILEYMAAQHHTPFKERNAQGIWRPTTSVKALNKMIGKYHDPFYTLIKLDRKYTKLAGTYLGWWKD